MTLRERLRELLGRLFEYQGAIVCLMLVLVLMAGCSGASMTANLKATWTQNASAAQTIYVQANAGTLSLEDCKAVMVNAAGLAQTAYTDETASGFTDIKARLNKKESLYLSDPDYVPPLQALTAHTLAAGDRALLWDKTPPDLVTANAYAAECCHYVLWVQGTTTVTTQAPSVNLTSKVTLNRMRSAHKLKDISGLLTQIEAKIPGFTKWVGSLPPAVQAQVNADIPVIAGWTVSLLTQYVTNIQCGDVIPADRMADNARTDVQELAAFHADGVAADAALTTHAQQQVAIITMIEDFVGMLVKIIPIP